MLDITYLLCIIIYLFSYCINFRRLKSGNAYCYISKQEFQNLISNKTQKTVPGIKKVLDNMLDEKYTLERMVSGAVNIVL